MTTIFIVSNKGHTVLHLTYQGSDVGELLVGGDQDGLYEELVAALRIWRWVLFHSLEKNYAHVLVCHADDNAPHTGAVL